MNPDVPELWKEALKATEDPLMTTDSRFLEDALPTLGPVDGHVAAARQVGVRGEHLALRLRSAGSEGEIVECPPGAYVLGRGEASDVRFGVADVAVSSRHALLKVEVARCSFEDLDSTNGTWQNGVRRESGRRWNLEPGDVLELGGHDGDPGVVAIEVMTMGGAASVLLGAKARDAKPRPECSARPPIGNVSRGAEPEVVGAWNPLRRIRGFVGQIQERRRLQFLLRDALSALSEARRERDRAAEDLGRDAWATGSAIPWELLPPAADLLRLRTEEAALRHAHHVRRAEDEEARARLRSTAVAADRAIATHRSSADQLRQDYEHCVATLNGVTSQVQSLARESLHALNDGAARLQTVVATFLETPQTDHLREIAESIVALNEGSTGLSLHATDLHTSLLDLERLRAEAASQFRKIEAAADALSVLEQRRRDLDRQREDQDESSRTDAQEFAAAMSELEHHRTPHFTALGNVLIRAPLPELVGRESLENAQLSASAVQDLELRISDLEAQISPHTGRG